MSLPQTRTSAWISLLAGLMLAAAAQAEGEMEILADEQDVDGQAGTATYRGNVEIRQQNLLIYADQVVFFENEDGEYDRAEMRGQPVHLISTPEGRAKTEAFAHFMEYNLQTEHLLMQGEARLKQERQDLRAERIEYDLPTERIRASRGDGEDERVRVRFERQSPDRENGS
ncbi:lipopolysaccharide transport periplasmic protein LptA [Natronospira bacteriovora]|uniref:Lipopolysaccharide transport periplasmic protein LptA n=1 Tax=Natronospira bacteriovora TaxID=3069753 RepID=A0ABU0W687_9GAMM|nr:lipopolysaccharide transport periplasmic protein LptA [Natronospira sp. AB-CW4]MDQ2069537.1 lipopolysaccharide transport periplasmic protein LptA [Natronospira sp. AB-CW4]